eukprot:tig00020614_g12145.t1
MTSYVDLQASRGRGTGTGFVTFRSAEEAEAALRDWGERRVPQPRATLGIRMSHAPDPRDIVWEHLAPETRRTHRVRALLGGALLFLLSAFWTVPVAYLSVLQHYEQLPVVGGAMNGVFGGPDSTRRSLFSAYLPSLMLVVFYAILPRFLAALSRAQGHALVSSERRTTARYFFSFLLLNTFILTATGLSVVQLVSVLTGAPGGPGPGSDALRTPEEVAGAVVAASSTFFVVYLLQWIFTVNAVDVLRPVALTRALLRRLRGSPAPGPAPAPPRPLPSQRRPLGPGPGEEAGPTPPGTPLRSGGDGAAGSGPLLAVRPKADPDADRFPFELSYAWHALLFAIGLTLGITNPLVSFTCAFFFATRIPLDKLQVALVFDPEPVVSGRLSRAALGFAYGALALFQLCNSAYLASRLRALVFLGLAVPATVVAWFLVLRRHRSASVAPAHAHGAPEDDSPSFRGGWEEREERRGPVPPALDDVLAGAAAAGPCGGAPYQNPALVRVAELRRARAAAVGGGWGRAPSSSGTFVAV